MQLTVINGSPRGERSNTKMLLDPFIKGFLETDGNHVELMYLKQIGRQDEFAGRFIDADAVFLAFPLYGDATPSIVTSYIERLAPHCSRDGNPAIGFLVQSGFPEAIHSIFVMRYLEKLARRLNCQYLGTIIKGGVEGIKLKPRFMVSGLLKKMYRLGQGFGKTGKLNPRILRRMARPMTFNWIRRLFARLVVMPLARSYAWDKELRKNGAYENRFDAP